jgi:hypothetical protein
MNRLSVFVAVSLCLLIAGCNECENGFKIKTEYKTIFWEDRWHESGKDTLLDGAVRTTTWASKDARGLTLRCFKASVDGGSPHYDLRYKINIPLLKRIGPELEKSGPIDIVVSVDGMRWWFSKRGPSRTIMGFPSLLT